MKRQWVLILLVIVCVALAVLVSGKSSTEFVLNADRLKWIQIPEGVLLPTVEQMNQRYTATLILGEQRLKFDDFVHLLGEGAQPIPSKGPQKERRYQSVDHASEMPRRLEERLADEQGTQGFTHDGLDYVTGTAITEGGAERAAPPMGLSVDEVIARCTQDLLPIFGEGYLSHARLAEDVRKQWDYEKKRWLTPEAYQDQFTKAPRAYVHYDHIYENGLKIDDLNEGIRVRRDANGLSSFSASWHTFGARPEQVLPMSLDEALLLAEKYCRRPVWLLSAELVYSNVTNAETVREKYDLHWLLTTEYGRYYINCVTGGRWADHNE